jgi:hypothetical protein
MADIAVLIGVLILNGLIGVILALNLAGMSERMARSHGYAPPGFRLPMSGSTRWYRIAGSLQVVLSCAALVWIAIRLM